MIGGSLKTPDDTTIVVPEAGIGTIPIIRQTIVNVVLKRDSFKDGFISTKYALSLAFIG